MLRGYWRIIFAVVGFVALTGEHPNPKAQAEQEQTEQSIANSLSNIAATNYDLAKRTEGSRATERCGPGKYESNDDLCAQWKAADAAQLAAWLNIAGLAAVLAALYAAFKSNSIARESAERQLRAYLIVESDGFGGTKGAPYPDCARLIVRNTGQTPARRIHIKGTARFMPPPVDYSNLPDGGWKELKSDSVIGGGQESTFTQGIKHDLIGEIFRQTRQGVFDIIIDGVITYDDVFDREWKTNFSFTYSGNDLDCTISPFGNDAT